MDDICVADCASHGNVPCCKKELHACVQNLCFVSGKKARYMGHAPLPQTQDAARSMDACAWHTGKLASAWQRERPRSQQRLLSGSRAVVGGWDVHGGGSCG